ncbi:MAG: hypothetical protein WA140_08870 [Geobacteraceae bacterium]
MAIKLGQLLINEKIITPEELDEALQSQVVFGGRLGSILIELGLVEEDELARLLSKKLQTPYAPQQMFEDISTDILALVPKEFILKHRVIPLGIEQRRLNLAMSDPSDLAAIDEIGFITGFVIIPMVVPEVRLVFSLEKYYGIKRDSSYLYRQWAPSRAKRKGADAEAEVPVPQASYPHPSEPEPFAEHQDSSEWPSIDLTDIEQEIATVDIPLPTSVVATPKSAVPFTLDSASAKLAEIKDRNEIADVIIQYAGQGFERVALFLIRGDRIAGWQAVVEKQPVAGFENFGLSLGKPSILKIVAEGRSFYRGPVLDTAENRQILSAMGGGFPETAYLIPISLMERVVTILYVDGKEADIGAKLFSLQKLANKVNMAFSMLILKNKIMAT